MTILVTVKTGSAVIMGADSKLTTIGIAGVRDDGSPVLLPQTYDHAVKITEDASGTAIAAFAGNGTIGAHTAAAYFSRQTADLGTSAAAQDVRVKEIVDAMVFERKAYAEALKADISEVPQTIVLLSAAPLHANTPRVWRIDLNGAAATTDEILKNPGIWFEGSDAEIMSLFYGISQTYVPDLATKLGIEESVLREATNKPSVQRAVLKINFHTMPTQDAIDLVNFCAGVQIEMERFLPGTPACGGPIDIFTIETAPNPRITPFYGKALHHPAASNPL